MIIRITNDEWAKKEEEMASPEPMTEKEREACVRGGGKVRLKSTFKSIHPSKSIIIEMHYTRITVVLCMHASKNGLAAHTPCFYGLLCAGACVCVCFVVFQCFLLRQSYDMLCFSFH